MTVNRVESQRGMLGVLGGMGPAPTADFYRKLVEATPATQDQDHIPIVVIGDPRIGDRSRAIETGAESKVLDGLMQRLRYLENIGVDAIAIPCNTAHHWLPSLRAATTIRFISLVEASVSEARRRHPTSSTALVLGTRATIGAHIYDAELEPADFSLVVPVSSQQSVVDSIISNVKAGAVELAAAIFEESAQAWLDKADVVFLACTELPVAAARCLQARPTLIDTTAALVNACVAWAAAIAADA